LREALPRHHAAGADLEQLTAVVGATPAPPSTRFKPCIAHVHPWHAIVRLPPQLAPRRLRAR
jgi:hypothetical protein